MMWRRRNTLHHLVLFSVCCLSLSLIFLFQFFFSSLNFLERQTKLLFLFVVMLNINLTFLNHSIFFLTCVYCQLQFFLLQLKNNEKILTNQEERYFVLKLELQTTILSKNFGPKYFPASLITRK